MSWWISWLNIVIYMSSQLSWWVSWIIYYFYREYMSWYVVVGFLSWVYVVVYVVNVKFFEIIYFTQNRSFASSEIIFWKLGLMKFFWNFSFQIVNICRDITSWIYVVIYVVISNREISSWNMSWYISWTLCLFESWEYVVIYVVICCRGFPVVSICRGICRECEIFWNHLFHSKQVFCKFWDHFLKAGVDEKFLIFFFRYQIVRFHHEIYRDLYRDHCSFESWIYVMICRDIKSWIDYQILIKKI